MQEIKTIHFGPKPLSDDDFYKFLTNLQTITFQTAAILTNEINAGEGTPGTVNKFLGAKAVLLLLDDIIKTYTDYKTRNGHCKQDPAIGTVLGSLS